MTNHRKKIEKRKKQAEFAKDREVRQELGFTYLEIQRKITGIKNQDKMGVIELGNLVAAVMKWPEISLQNKSRSELARKYILEYYLQTENR